MTDSTKRGLSPQFESILEAKASDAVLQAVKTSSEQCATSQGEAILALDMRFFCKEATATAGERVEAVLTLLQVFVADPAEEADDDEIPVSMRRALPVDAEAGANESNVFRKAICQSEKLSERFIAGVVLLDVVSYSWKQHNFEAEESNLLHVSTCNQLDD